MAEYSVVDLFAGAGGLSLGFQQTMKYDIKVAFENNPDMQATYKHNYPEVDVRGDVCDADYTEIKKEYGCIDIVIGGPPCQGFSNANRQKNHAVSMNNMLVKQYIRAILELHPKAFVMENVSMLRSEVHRFYLSEDDKALVDEYGIPYKETSLVLLDSEFCFDGALDIIKDINRVTEYLWDALDYTELNVIYKATKNPKKLIDTMKKHRTKLVKICKSHVEQNSADYIIKVGMEAFNAVRGYYDNTVLAEELRIAIEPAIMIQRMLNHAMELYDNKLIVERYSNEGGITAIIRSFAVYDYLKGILESKQNGYVINSKVLCAADYGAPQKRMRFVVIGIKKSISSKVALPNGRYDEDQYLTVHDAIGDLDNVVPVTNLTDDIGIILDEAEEISDLGKSLRDSHVLRNHIITNTTKTAMERFCALKPGQNFHALDESLKTNTYTDAARTQNTIYLRLDYNEPSGTVVNVRKSMWVHPTLDRAISVREAARLQTFPDSFVFCGSKDQQYQQVGNAVPPIMAKSIAEKLASLLK